MTRALFKLALIAATIPVDVALLAALLALLTCGVGV